MRLTRTVLTLALAATTTTALPVSGEPSDQKGGSLNQRQEGSSSGQSSHKQGFSGYDRSNGHESTFYDGRQSPSGPDSRADKPPTMGVGSNNIEGQGKQPGRTNGDDEITGNGRQNPNLPRDVNPNPQDTSQWSKTGSNGGSNMNNDKDPRSGLSSGLFSFLQPHSKGQDQGSGSGSQNQEIRGGGQGMLIEVPHAPHVDADNGNGRQPTRGQNQASGPHLGNPNRPIATRQHQVDDGNENSDDQVKGKGRGQGTQGDDQVKGNGRQGQGAQGDDQVMGKGRGPQGNDQTKGSGQDPRMGNAKNCMLNMPGCISTDDKLDSEPKPNPGSDSSIDEIHDETRGCRIGDDSERCIGGELADSGEVHHGLGPRSHHNLAAGHGDSGGHSHQNGGRQDRGYAGISKSGDGSMGHGGQLEQHPKGAQDESMM
ncbi:hypothetical protein B0H67DRAFT_148330 [Lasiosphaeris hirsuta]|uniref:Uncharacterized protein n=1 Tax=Lasiosphaeris hirsuta TaxID=260670 RepID=A0AA40DXF0_9PEZI|nr:hypothetical protein B0H67DRAFT_148330 [Lasiosphaeris hirsuta]